MSRLLDIAAKDIKLWLRDPGALGVLLGMPVVLIMILGSAFGGIGGENSSMTARVAIVNLDAGASSPTSGELAVGDEIVSAFKGDTELAGLFKFEFRDDAEKVRHQVERGDMVAALIIPADLSQSIADAKPVRLEVLRDPGSDLSSGIFESVVRSIANELSRISVVARTASATFAEAGMPPQLVAAKVGQALSIATAEGATPPVTVRETKARLDKQIKALDYVSLAMTSMFLLFGAMFGAFAFVTERREQTMARLLTTPTRRSSYIGGKMLGIFGLGLLQFAALYAYTKLVMHVDWGENFAAILMIVVGELAAAAGLAVLIASIAKTERGVGGIGPALIQVMALLGGAFFQISIMPKWLQPIRFTSVIGWAMEAFQKIQLQSAGPSGVVGEFAALLAFAVAFFAIGVWRLRDTR